MMISKFSKREQLLLVITIVIVTITLSYGFIIEPLIGAFSNLNRQIETGRLKLQKASKMLMRQDIITEEYKKYVNFLKPAGSDEEEIASMLKTIESIARKNNIHISNIRPQPAKERGYYKEFIFELISEADIDHLIKFIYDLQVSGNLLRVDRLTLSASSSKEGLKAVMEITKPSVAKIDI